MVRSPTGVTAPSDGEVTAGLSATVSLTVSEADTAEALGSGEVPVLGTPRLVALCEAACCRAVEGRLAAGRTSVASRIRFEHLAPVAIGEVVRAEATLRRVEGRRLVFTVCARQGADAHGGVVGAGQVTRVLVDTAKFLAKAGRTGGH